MPQLVRGHMLYTDADYVWEDFQEMATNRNRNKSRRTLAKILQRKLVRLQAQQLQAQQLHAQQLQAQQLQAQQLQAQQLQAQQLQAPQEQLQILTDMLSIFTALAAKEGYKLSDLVKNDLVKNI